MWWYRPNIGVLRALREDKPCHWNTLATSEEKTRSSIKTRLLPVRRKQGLSVHCQFCIGFHVSVLHWISYTSSALDFICQFCIGFQTSAWLWSQTSVTLDICMALITDSMSHMSSYSFSPVQYTNEQQCGCFASLQTPPPHPFVCVCVCVHITQ